MNEQNSEQAEPSPNTPAAQAPEPQAKAAAQDKPAAEQQPSDLSTDETNPAEPAHPWQFQAEDSKGDSVPHNGQRAAPTEPIVWTASEFVHHAKSVGWYAALALAAVVLAVIIFLLTHDKISTGVVIFAALIFAFYAHHKPRVLDYKLDSAGLTIDKKFYGYESFKAFALAEEGAFFSIVLMPLKRFGTTKSIYFDPKDESKIVNILSDRLPLDEHHQDAVDRFMHRIRF